MAKTLKKTRQLRKAGITEIDNDAKGLNKSTVEQFVDKPILNTMPGIVRCGYKNSEFVINTFFCISCFPQQKKTILRLRSG